MSLSIRIAAGLDDLNFFLADVRDGLGPYLAVYLLSVRHWDAQSIGLVMSVMGVSTMLAQAPAGGLIDATRWKRGLVAGAAIVISATCIAITVAPGFWPVALGKAVMGAATAVFAPAVAAISLGAVGRRAFTRRTGRNESFNHLGNAVAAVAAGLVGWLFSPVAVFYLVALFGLGSVLSVLAIPARAIDHERARGLGREDAGGVRPSGFRVLLEYRPLLVFAGCVALFHLANAAMLPLVGQDLALQHADNATLYMAGCIIGAQLVMVPMAILVGRKADAWGRQPIFLAGFAVLPLRGVLYTLSDDRFWLLGVQMLDGVGAGIFGVLFPLVVADLMRGTGRFNVSQGAVATAQGVGAALSTTLAGWVVVRAGYDAAFLTLAAIAAAAFLLFLVAMPETQPTGIDARPAETPRAGRSPPLPVADVAGVSAPSPGSAPRSPN